METVKQALVNSMIWKGSVKQPVCLSAPEQAGPPLHHTLISTLMKTCICKEDRLESKFKAPIFAIIKELYDLLSEPLPLQERLVLVTA